MKVAMWAVGILVICLFGVVLVNLFGNITVTDQLNYTTMKNTVEAAMYDSLDVTHYRAGFCLCTNREKTAGKWIFDSVDEYELVDINYDENNNEKCDSSSMNYCEILYGEYRIKPKVFSESLIRRFAEMVNNNKDYTIVIQDIIEYPPKVSVRILSKDKEYSPTEAQTDDSGYTINNQIDAIIETKSSNIGKDVVPSVTAEPVVTAEPTSIPTVEPGPSTYTVKVMHCAKGTVEEKNGNTTCTKVHSSDNIADNNSKDVVEVKNYDSNELITSYKSYSWDGNLPKGVTKDKDGKHTVIVGTEDLTVIYEYTKGAQTFNCSWHHDEVEVKWEYKYQTCTGELESTSVGIKCMDGEWVWTTDKRSKIVPKQTNYGTCSEAKNDCVKKAKDACEKGFTCSYECEGRQSYTYKCIDGASGSFDVTCDNADSCALHCGGSWDNVDSCSCNG